MTYNNGSMTESSQILRKKLLYISTHRGTKEGDLIIGGFAKTYIFELTASEVKQFSEVLQYPDGDIMDWVKFPHKIPDSIEKTMVDKIRTFISSHKLSTFD